MKVGARHYRTIWLADDGRAVEVIDQTNFISEIIGIRFCDLIEINGIFNFTQIDNLVSSINY